MRNVQMWKVVIWIAALAIACPALWLPNFWPTFLIPAAVFLVLQLLAIGSWRQKETLFKVTDYVYYLLIGTVIALGSRFILQAEQVEALDEILETKSMQHRLKQIDAELPRLQSDLEVSRRSEAAKDPQFVADCQREQLAIRLRLRGRTESEQRELLRFDPCESYFALMDKITVLPIRISSLQQEHIASSARLKELKFKDGSSTLETGATRSRDPRRLELEFLWAPMLLLVGVAIKLSKTTCSLWPLPR